jgi:hypothetical protein
VRGNKQEGFISGKFKTAVLPAWRKPGKLRRKQKSKANQQDNFIPKAKKTTPDFQRVAYQF